MAEPEKPSEQAFHQYGSFGFFEVSKETQPSGEQKGTPAEETQKTPVQDNEEPNERERSPSKRTPPMKMTRRGLDFRRVTVVAPSTESSSIFSKDVNEEVDEKSATRLSKLPVPLRMTYNSSNAQIPGVSSKHQIKRIIPNVPQDVEDKFLLDYFKRSQGEKRAISQIQSWWRMVVVRAKYHRILAFQRKVRNSKHRILFRAWLLVVNAAKWYRKVMKRKILRHWKHILDMLKTQYGTIHEDSDLYKKSILEELTNALAEDNIRMTIPEKHRYRAFRHSDKLLVEFRKRQLKNLVLEIFHRWYSYAQRSAAKMKGLLQLMHDTNNLMIQERNRLIFRLWYRWAKYKTVLKRERRVYHFSESWPIWNEIVSRHQHIKNLEAEVCRKARLLKIRGRFYRWKVFHSLEQKAKKQNDIAHHFHFINVTKNIFFAWRGQALWSRAGKYWIGRFLKGWRSFVNQKKKFREWQLEIRYRFLLSTERATLMYLRKYLEYRQMIQAYSNSKN